MGTCHSPTGSGCKSCCAGAWCYAVLAAQEASTGSGAFGSHRATGVRFSLYYGFPVSRESPDTAGVMVANVSCAVYTGGVGAYIFCMGWASTAFRAGWFVVGSLGYASSRCLNEIRALVISVYLLIGITSDLNF